MIEGQKKRTIVSSHGPVCIYSYLLVVFNGCSSVYLKPGFALSSVTLCFYIAKIHQHDQYTNLRLGQTNHALLTLVNTINEKHMYLENSPYSNQGEGCKYI